MNPEETVKVSMSESASTGTDASLASSFPCLFIISKSKVQKSLAVEICWEFLFGGTLLGHFLTVSGCKD